MITDIAIPEDADYALNVSWTDWETGEELTGTLGYGEYMLELELLPPTDDYLFSEDVAILINGEPVDEEIWDVAVYDDSLYLSLLVEIAPENGFVEDVTLSGAPDAVVAGEAITAPTLTVEEGDITVTDVQWLDEDDEPVTGAFQDGQAYYLVITLAADEGYALRSGTYIEVLADDKVFNSYAEKNEDGTASLYVRYSLIPTVDAVEIEVAEPAVGGTPAVLTVPADAHYTIDSYAWYDADTGEEATVFEKGKAYALDIYLSIEEGYELAEEAAATVNGAEADYFDNYGTQAELVHTYSFKEKISVVDFPALPEVQVGDEVDMSMLDAPEDAHYELLSYWMVGLGGFETEAFVGEIEDKNVYYLVLVAAVEEGYEFTEDVPITVKGQPFTGLYRFVTSQMVMTVKQYSFGLTEIDKVELTVEAPAVGNRPGEVTVPADAPYYLEELNWSVSDTDDMMDADELEEGKVFLDGKYYWLGGVLMADEGHVFAEGLTIMVNGRPVDMSALTDIIEIPTAMGDMAIVLHGFGKLAAEIEEDNGKDETGDNTGKPGDTDGSIQKPGEDNTTSPDTGDSAILPMLATLAAFAAVALLTLTGRKNRA